jgi:hypothetical protein
MDQQFRKDKVHHNINLFFFAFSQYTDVVFKLFIREGNYGRAHFNFKCKTTALKG